MDDFGDHYFAAAAADPKRLASFKMKLVDQICQGEKEKGDLQGALGPMKTDVVEK
jgi:hypothetical protein